MAAARSAPATGSWLVVRESYTIKTGDTLWAIARDHGVTIEDLQSWNNIPDPNRILAGDRLIVRQGTRDTPAGSSPETGKPYTIRTGDTLWAIARDHGVTIEDLQSWNNIPDPNMIFAGNKLIVRQGTRNTPGAYTEQSGVSARDSTAAASAMPAMQEQCRDAQEERARHLAGAVAPRPSDQEIKPQAFLSHTGHTFLGKQGEAVPYAPNLVREIHSVLVQRGRAAFYDVHNLDDTLGRPWGARIVEQVKKSSVFVAILTPAFSQRFWPMYELHLALQGISQRRIVPVLYGTTFDDVLQNFNKFDPAAKWMDEESEKVVQDLIESSVKNLKTLRGLQGIRWNYAGPFHDKNSIATFGERVANKVEICIIGPSS